MKSREEVYAIIEEHYRSNFKDLVKRLSSPGGSSHNAEDIIQEAYTRALQYWNSYNIEQDFKKWFHRILMNCLKDKLKEERSQGSATEKDFVDDGEHAINKIMLNEIMKEVDKLEDTKKFIIKLFFLEQFKTKEIADLVLDSHENIRLTIHNFRKKMRFIYSDEAFV